MELVNSRRRLDKVTYTPLIVPAAQEAQDGGGALEIASYVNGLGLVSGEAAALLQSAQGHTAEALRAMESLVTATDPAQRLAESAALAKISAASLSDAVERVRGQRETVTASAIEDLKSLITEYRDAERRREQQAQSGSALNDRLRSLEARVDLLVSDVQASSPSSRARALVSPGFSASEIVAEVSAKAIPEPAVQIPSVVASRLGSDLASSAWAAVRWADSDAPARARRFSDITAVSLAPEMHVSAATLLLQGLPHLIGQVQKATSIKSALTRRTLQPIGLLHLEQLVMTPLDVERGELVYSLPLAPREKATVAHKEWSLRQEEYSRFVQDYFENYSERGVAEKSDISVSSKSESEHSKTLSMSLPTGSGGATLADPVAQAGAVDVTTEKQSQEKSRRDTREVTERASALAIRDQKVSFTVTTVSGREDFTARLYENNTDDKVMLVDYYRRMRKWQNELFRVGVRLTYDVVLPDPGRRLRDRWKVLADLDAQIAAPFEFTLGVPAAPDSMWIFSAASTFTTASVTTALLSKFDFDTASVDDLVAIGRRYGITLPPAPDTLKAFEEVKDVTQKPAVGQNAVSFSFKLSGIPDTHRAKRVYIGGRCDDGGDGAYISLSYWSGLDMRLDKEAGFKQASRAVGASESTTPNLAITGAAFYGATGEVRAWVDIEPTAAAWRDWRGQVWSALRQAAMTRYNEKREALRQQRAAAQQLLEAPDALQLRRMEREQIAHLVLDWLFPDFGKGASATTAADASTPVWQNVLEYGEYTKFVQDAIDWDRVLVLLYPYFWDTPEQHAAKLYLDHPDGLHREFLRAGAARVVLAIRPGFEEQVVSLLDQGKLGDLAPASRFRPLIDAVTARERTFQQRRDAALVPPEKGEVPQEVASWGDSIGTWFDWTPTSALDMDVQLKDLL